jgi:uncharacterized membrane protein YbhN (UPF0104 family)
LLIQNKNIKLILNYFGGPLVFSLLLYSIVVQLQRQASWQTSLNSLYLEADVTKISRLVAVMLLMFVNWGLEGVKWRLVMRGRHRISFKKSMKAVFAGNALAFFTPNRVGEYFGRMLFLKKDQRIPSLPSTLLCSYSQLMVTLSMGLVGLTVISGAFIYRFSEPRLAALIGAFKILIIILLVLLTILYFHLREASVWLQNKRILSGWLTRIRVLEDVNATVQIYLLSLSIARYLVFAVQYYLVFRVFGVDVHWWQAFWAVSVVFLVIAVLPSMGFLSELGIRWQAGIQVVQIYSTNIAGIFASSLAIWLINLVIPAIIGGMLILALKLFDNKTDCNRAGFT